MIRRFSLLGALTLMTLTLPACDSGPEEFRFDVYPTDGQVVSKGQPVPRAIVRFHPTDPSKARVPEGKQGPEVVLTTQTDADGKFVMSTYLADDGIPAGDYVVTVAALGRTEEESVENSDGKAAKPAPKAGPSKKYRDPSTSTLKATIKTDGENHFTFELD